MDLPPGSLSATLHFSTDDLDANRRGAYSKDQRSVVVLLGKIVYKQGNVFVSTRPSRTATQPLPQIHAVTGRAHTFSETRFVRSGTSGAGCLVETFVLVVHGPGHDVELPISQEASLAFEPERPYTVYYFINKNIPTLLSVHANTEGDLQ